MRITDGTGKGIYDAIMTHLQGRGLVAKKIMGLGTDGASTMTGIGIGLFHHFLKAFDNFTSSYIQTIQLRFANLVLNQFLPEAFVFLMQITCILSFQFL